jgi:hypothetical protein
MDHTQAVRSDAAEKYLLSELTDAERDAFEEHYFSCAECADEVRVGAIFMDNAREALAPQRVTVEKPISVTPSRWLRLFWPMPVGALAAAALLVMVSAYQGFVIMPRLRGQLAESEGIQAVSWHFLTVSRSSPNTLRVTPGQRALGLTLSRSSTQTHPYYRCALSDADGGEVFAGVVPAPPQGDELQILVPIKALKPGDYILTASGMPSPTSKASDPEPARYHFTLQIEQGEKR